VAIFLALWVWEGTGAIQHDKYLKWSPSPPENNVVRQENPKIVISPVIAVAVNTVSFF
jgi:hypothetical protein